VTTALPIWILYPTQIESGLSLFHHRHIREWLTKDFTMSSRELLVLLEELPETSLFKIARDRTYRVVRHLDEVKTFTTYGRLSDDVELLAEGVVDWTKAEHVQARIARELAVFNAQDKADFTGLIPPLHEWAESETEVTDEQFDAASAAIEAQLNGRR
jgi:hypothetical protein